MFTDGGHDGKQVFTVSQQYSKGLFLGRKKGNNTDKNLHRVIYSCLIMTIMTVDKNCKFQSNICNGFEKKVEWYEKRNQNTKSKNGHNSYKNLERVMYSCLFMEVMMVSM